MGVRLVKFDRYGRSNTAYSYDHEDLINRDSMNQHPIYAITGLQEVLNILEDSIADINQFLVEHSLENIETNIDDINDKIEDIYKQIQTCKIQTFRTTNSVQMVYDDATQTLKADVRIHSDKIRDNMIQSMKDGLYVPAPTTQNTYTVSWQKAAQTGITYNIQEMFNGSNGISHYYKSWSAVYNEQDADGWTFSNSTFYHEASTGSMTGIVTEEYYDYYINIVTVSSDDADDDVMGIIIAYAIDEDGKPHTLSIVFDREKNDDNYVLWYDYGLPDQKRLLMKGNVNLGTKPSGTAIGNWSECPGGIVVQVIKDHDIIEVKTTNWGGGSYNAYTLMRLDLYDFPWGELFRGPVRIGFMAQSQAHASFRVSTFNSRVNPARYNLLANVRVSSDAQNEILIKTDGIFAPKFNISSQSGNGLVKYNDGYYVRAAISKEADNALIAKTDGLYTRDYKNIRTVVKSNHGFIVGDFIYYHPSSGYLKARAYDYYDINIVGMVTKVINVNSFEYQWGGFFPTNLFTDSNGYTQGMPLYISATAGKVTQVQPDISKAVGYPVENAGIVISIERGVQYNQEANIGDMKTSANNYNVRSDGFIKVVEEVEFKKSLVTKLLDVLTDDFKTRYMTINSESVQFINVLELYNSKSVPYGLNLFIKAF